ncbi:MAG: hypothetical protein PVJ64_10925 [Gemmatimonadales bacterium]
MGKTGVYWGFWDVDQGTLQLLGVGEVEADARRDEEIVEPRPELTGLDHGLQSLS